MTNEYTYLFNTITKTIEQLEALIEALKLAQQQAEEFYLERGD